MGRELLKDTMLTNREIVVITCQNYLEDLLKNVACEVALKHCDIHLIPEVVSELAKNVITSMTIKSKDTMKSYTTLKELKDALDSKELVLGKLDKLIIDNDSTDLYTQDPNSDDEDDTIEVFSLHPQNLLEEALELLGIPWGNA